MTRYEVRPKRANRKGWRVTANGRTTSRHRNKTNAIDAARDRATSGDTIMIRDKNDQFQFTETV